MPVISFANQEVAYADTAVGAGVLLILPDNLHTAAGYRSEIDHFADRYRVISLEYPGEGRSTRDVLYKDERELDL